MQVRSDFEAALTTRLLLANNSGLVPPARVTQEIQDATLWAGKLFWWPPLQRCRVTTAQKNIQSLNYDYYDYPSDFLTDSIKRLYIDGISYSPKAYLDFLDYCDSSINPMLAPSPTNHFFANYGRQYFVYPTYAGSGAPNNLLVWGNIQHPPLATPSTPTIFTYWDDAGNEAIVKKAMSVILKRVDPGISASEEQDAIALLGMVWKPIADAQQRAQRLNHQHFAVPDYFGFGGGLSVIGNFNIPVDVSNL